MIISTLSYLLVALIGLTIGVLLTRRNTADSSDKSESVEKTTESPPQTYPLQSLLIRTTNEMRTPLNSIVGLSSVLEDSKLNSQQKENVKMIRLAGDNLLSLIKDIQYYSRIETGSEASEISSFNISQVIEETIEDKTDMLASKPIEVTFFIDPELPTAVAADTSHIRLILGNLVSNAAKYTRSGEIQIRVAPQKNEGSENQHLLFEIKDTGIGISEDHLSRIFSPIDPDAFNKEDFLFGGFGLYISQKVCKLIGGRLEAESKEYEGSTFTFTAPFFNLEAKQIPEKRTTPTPFTAPPSVILATFSTSLGRSLSQYFERSEIELTWVSEEVALAETLVSPAKPNTVLLFDTGWIDRPSDKQHKWGEKLKHCETPTVILGNEATYSKFTKDPVFSQVPKIHRPIRPSKIVDSLRRAKSPQRINAATQAPFQANEVDGVTRAPYQTGTLKILIAEDDKINQKVISMMLKRLGHTSDLAEDGSEALEMASKERYDIIFMDLNMPNLSGIEAAKAIFEKSINPDDRPTIIAITAAVTPANQVACREVGMKGFISKPVKLAVLKKAISSVKPRVTELA
ncbi:MAG: response regulator [Opitutales bacterium]